jgi:hypothetical protein
MLFQDERVSFIERRWFICGDHWQLAIGNWQLAVVVSQNQVFPAPETKDAI